MSPLAKKKAIVLHSGGMDSSICMALAIRAFGVEEILSMSIRYQQRHANELDQAKKICKQWGVAHAVVDVDCLKELTENALLNRDVAIKQPSEGPPNTLVLGRNGLMARLGAIHAHHLGAHCLYMGVIEVEEWNSGYRDCSRAYMDLKQQILRIDLDDPAFEIRTPLVNMSKKETMELAHRLGILEFLWEETISCYEGIRGSGCLMCPACQLRNEGMRLFLKEHPHLASKPCFSKLFLNS
ncbi:MAG: 7-cyano-7-deazaguanine synthase QueC [Waddliaceae bacterium]